MLQCLIFKDGGSSLQNQPGLEIERRGQLRHFHLCNFSRLPTTTTRRLSPTTIRPISLELDQFAYLSPCFLNFNNLVVRCKIISIEVISSYLIIRPSGLFPSRPRTTLAVRKLFDKLI